MNRKIDHPCIMVIFGGTGDLAHRKLLPAIYRLGHDGMLPESFLVVGTGRKPKSHEQYREELRISIGKHSRLPIETGIWDNISERVFYFQMDFPDAEKYGELKEFLERLDQRYNTCGNRLYYLSVAPTYFEMIARNLKKNHMADNIGSWQSLMVEKPFGRDLATAQYLNDCIKEAFPEENIFRIDHYLGKEMLQNLLVIRFGNVIFESIWNSRYIDNIQITSSETFGVEGRAEYYESAGALRDMLQNHLLQLLALVAMEPPASIDAKSIGEEKIKVFRSLGKIGPGNVHTDIIRGQYGRGSNGKEVIPAYREENGVAADSNTETFVAMKLFVGNFRWGNMPFYLRTGKRMAKKATSIFIEFKSMPEILYFKEYDGMQPNILEIRVQPEEGISFQINSKKPGTSNEIATEKMDFCQSCRFAGNSPEAYERLIADALRKDHTLFTGWDEIEASWRFADSILEMWKEEGDSGLPNYPPGSWGPAKADELLKKDGRTWWEPQKSDK